MSDDNTQDTSAAPAQESGVGQPGTENEQALGLVAATASVLQGDLAPNQPRVRTIVKDDEPVTVLVPKDFNLHADSGVLTEYKAGIQQMPRWHFEHWFTKAIGVVEHVVEEVEEELKKL